MAESGGYERLPGEASEALLERVLEFRQRSGQYGKPDDLSALQALFPRVRVRQGYVLDYALDREGEAAVHIQPFARPRDREEILLPPLPADAEEMAAAEVELLYQYLDYENTAQGLFEYAFFVLELHALHASYHDAEWLASTPVFSRRRFDELVAEAERVDGLSPPAFCGPEAALQKRGGRVRFPVHTVVGWARIYLLEIGVSADGRMGLEAGEVFADFGRGELF